MSVVLFIDSGVGGLPYCRSFRELQAFEEVVYVADRAHFPYGSKSKEELIDILVSLTEQLLGCFDVKLIVIACNTASVSTLEALRSRFKLPFVGTVPAVKPAALASRKRRIGVLATERTVNDPYIQVLAKRFAPDCELIPMAAPELVDFVEHSYVHSDHLERLTIARPYIEYFKAQDVDALVLGCTHFLFLAEEFSIAAGEDIKVVDSCGGVARRAAQVLEEQGIKASATDKKPTGLLLLNSDQAPAASWQLFASLFDLEFRTMREGSL
ncbi:glutamate racemase [Treponema sp.]